MPNSLEKNFRSAHSLVIFCDDHGSILFKNSKAKKAYRNALSIFDILPHYKTLNEIPNSISNKKDQLIWTIEKNQDHYLLLGESAEDINLSNKQVVNTIAHDLRIPLASIAAIAQGLNLFLDPLIEGYEKAKASHLDVAPIQHGKLAVLKSAAARALSEIKFANHYIDMMLGSLNQDAFKTDTYDVLLFSQVLHDAINSYPYRDEQRSLVHVDLEADFAVWADAFYIKHIINHLFENAFYFIAETGKGEIYLWTEAKENKNVLHVKDTAKGASADICKKLFKSYFTQKGTGLGLAFCKMMMKSFHGDIRAESVHGEYMHFILSFPSKY